MICQPQRLPAAADRQLCVLNVPRARPIARAASTICAGVHAGFVGGELRRELRVELLQRDDEVVEGDGEIGPIGAQVAAPVDPGRA